MRFGWFLTVALLGALTGCVPSASISSARDSTSVASFRRLYVAIDEGNAAPLFAQALNDALVTDLQQHGVTVKTRILSGLDLDENVVNVEMKAWHPDGLVTVMFSGGTGGNENLESVTYNVSLIDFASNLRIWRAQVSSSRGALGTTAGMMKETAARVCERLEQDRLIASRH